MLMHAPKFKLGHLVATPGALAAMEKTKQNASEFLRRHLQCDWGDLDASDKSLNDADVNQRGRLFSAYHLTDGTKIWIITEADRSSTCILLPNEY